MPLLAADIAVAAKVASKAAAPAPTSGDLSAFVEAPLMQVPPGMALSAESEAFRRGPPGSRSAQVGHGVISHFFSVATLRLHSVHTYRFQPACDL